MRIPRVMEVEQILLLCEIRFFLVMTDLPTPHPSEFYAPPPLSSFYQIVFPFDVFSEGTGGFSFP